MEATTRQLNYIQVLAKRAGKDIAQKKVEGLSKEEASRTIDRLQEEVGGDEVSEAETTPERRVNKPLFGLAAKLVWKRYLATGEAPEKDQFPRDVIQTYKRLLHTQRMLKKELEGGAE